MVSNSTASGAGDTWSTSQTSSVNANPVALTETPRASDAFVDSIGVNTHLHYTGTPYTSSYSTVRDLLKVLGVRHLRDTLNYDTWQAYFDRLNELASLGIHADLVAGMNESLSDIKAVAAKVPRALESIEGPNEYNVSGDADWIAKTRAYQKVLYTGVKSSPAILSLPVIGPSMTSYEGYVALGDLSQYLDKGNMHDYFGAHYPGNAVGAVYPPGTYGSLKYFMGSAALASGHKPIESTQTGYQDSPSAPTPVTASIKARYTMRSILQHWNGRVERTYLYELVDEGGQSYGLISPGLEVKPAYVAVENLISSLADGSAPVALKPLTYSMSADASVQHTLLQKRDGSYRLMLWIAAQAIDPVVPTQTVTIKTAAHFGSVAQYQWTDSGTVQTIPLTQGPDETIVLTVTDRVTELKLAK